MLEIDFETRSDRDVTKVGVYVYAESPHTDVLMASYKLHGGFVRRWRRGEPCPADIRAHVEAGGMITAHNAGFERILWRAVLTPRYGWPKPAVEQFRCTAVTAAAMSLPRSLDKLGMALDLPVKKDGKGRLLIRRHSMPKKIVDGQPVWNDDPAGLAEFHDYCDTDVETEAAADSRLIPLSDYEQAVYVLNEKINDRGLLLDVESLHAAVEIIEKAKKAYDREMTEVTGGYVKSCTAVSDLLAFCQASGVALDNVQEETVEEVLHEYEGLPDAVRRALELRQEAGKTSTAKLSKMLERVCADGRVRGVYLHHGAGQTGRFSSRGVQCHNMPKYRKCFEEAVMQPNGKMGLPDLDILFDNIRSRSPEWLQFCYGPVLGRPLHLLSDAVRSFIMAPEGHDFINADYASIEGRMAPWIAHGDEWKLDAYRALDRGEGHGIYELAAAGIYGIPVEDVKKTHRTTGKVAELSCQYETGAAGIRKFARKARVKLPALYPALVEAADPETVETVSERYEERVAAHDATALGLGREGWMAAELIKRGWRAKHPGIVAAWKALDEAARDAVMQPGVVVTPRDKEGRVLIPNVQYVVRQGFLWCRLPSGRCLAYGAPKFQEVEVPWADKTLPPEQREKKVAVTVMGVDSQTEKWIRYSIYGGSLFNNVVQGTARDILVHGMLNAEAAGYPIVLHTHDEPMAEVPEGFGSVEEFERIICDLPSWADGLPLVASGWRGKRYKKD